VDLYGNSGKGRLCRDLTYCHGLKHGDCVIQEESTSSSSSSVPKVSPADSNDPCTQESVQQLTASIEVETNGRCGDTSALRNDLFMQLAGTPKVNTLHIIPRCGVDLTLNNVTLGRSVRFLSSREVFVQELPS